MMRKINSIIALLIVILFIDHVIFSSLHLLSLNVSVSKPMVYFMVGLIITHAVLSIILTINSVKVKSATKAPYQRSNSEYWLRRDSGLAIILFAAIHIYSRQKLPNGRPIASTMGIWATINTIMLALSVTTHILINIRPLFISLGLNSRDKKKIVVALIVIAICILGIGANIIFRINRH